MKNQLLKLTMTAISVTFPIVVFGTHFPPVRELLIPAAPDGVIIDGIDDEIYGDLQTTSVFNPTGWGGPDDFTVSFKAAYDPQYLYLWIDVIDAIQNNVTSITTPEPWGYDNIEVYLDLDTTGSGTNTGYDNNSIQLRFNRGLKDLVQTPGRAAQEEYKYLFENTAHGWVHEVAVPWTCVLGDDQIPEDMMDYLGGDSRHGFDLHGSDSDTPTYSNRQSQTAWDSDDPDTPEDRTEDSAWDDLRALGVIRFEDFNWTDFEFDHGTGIQQPSKHTFNVYPNPATNKITFDTERPCIVEIYSIIGVKVLVAETTGTIDISSLNSGLYIVRMGNKTSTFVAE